MKIWNSVKSLARGLWTVKAAVCALVISVTVSVCNSAYADFITDIGLLTVDTAPVFAIGLIVITGLAAIWAINKTIGLIRSR